MKHVVYTPKEAAEYLGISAERLTAFAREGKVPAFKVGGSWRFLMGVLDDWMEKESAGNVIDAERYPEDYTPGA